MRGLKGRGFEVFKRRAPHVTLMTMCLVAALASAGCGGDDDDGSAPATPVLVDALDGPCTMPGSSPFPLLPAQAVRVKVGAAWPGDLVVTANGTPLENVGPSDTQRQSDLKAAGTAFWI